MELKWMRTEKDGWPKEPTYILACNNQKDNPVKLWWDGDECFRCNNLIFAYHVPKWWMLYEEPALSNEEIKEQKQRQDDFEKHRKQYEEDNNFVATQEEVMEIVNKHLKKEENQNAVLSSVKKLRKFISKHLWYNKLN